MATSYHISDIKTHNMKKTFLEWLEVLKDCNCHICNKQNLEQWVCERCDNIYCDSCSVSYTYHNPVDYNCCLNCINS